MYSCTGGHIYYSNQSIMQNDTFRRRKVNLTTEQLLRIDLIKCEAEKLLLVMKSSSELVEKKCINIAKIKLEEAVMWAVKGFTNYSDNISDITRKGESK